MFGWRAGEDPSVSSSFSLIFLLLLLFGSEKFERWRANGYLIGLRNSVCEELQQYHPREASYSFDASSSEGEGCIVILGFWQWIRKLQRTYTTTIWNSVGFFFLN